MKSFASAAVAAVILCASTEVGRADDFSATPAEHLVGVPIQLDPIDTMPSTSGITIRPEWSWEARPPTSVADLSATDVLRPIFTPDVDGTYVARLELFDANDPAPVAPLHRIFMEVSSGNLTPVAKIRARGIPGGGVPLTLDGTPSFDVDGDRLSYAWTLISSPTGSASSFGSTSSPITQFNMDLEGDYVVGLEVQDSAGASSRLATYDISYLPFSGSTDTYRTAYDATLPSGGAASEIYDLGDRTSGNGSHVRIPTFRLSDGGGIADVLSVGLVGGINTASSAADLLALVDVLELDADPTTNARMSPNSAINDLTFEFGAGNGSVTLEGVIGTALLRADLLLRGVDNYEAAGGRLVSPVASGRFDQIPADVGELVVLDPHASTDIDGDVLAVDGYLSFAPAATSSMVSFDADGFGALTPDSVGDYLVTLDVSDGSFTSSDSVLVVAGNNVNVRPVARIESVANAQSGSPLMLDGTQSYDLNGDLISHSWSILYAPPTSAAAIIDAAAPRTSFAPDVPGLYVVQLQVADSERASVPVTYALVAGASYPIAEAGPDQIPDQSGQVQLDGSLSQGSGLSFFWSSIGLNGDGAAASLNDPNGIQPTVNLSSRSGPFRDVIKSQSVYHLKRSDNGGLCAFDVRLPSNLTASSAEPVSITLHSRGVQNLGSGSISVWEIENKNDLTRDVTLIDEFGVTHGTFPVPGKVSVHVTTPAFGRNDGMSAFVGGVEEAQDGAKTNPFNRNNPVCTGPGSGVVQLIASGTNGHSLPDTVFIGNANIRPILSTGPDLLLMSGDTTTLRGSDYGFDRNGDALSYSWSLIAKPAGSSAQLGAAPIELGDTIDLTPDRTGTYLVQVLAFDGELFSEPAVIWIEVQNSAPSAVAAIASPAFVGDTVTLDGAGSFDPDGDALSYAWSLVSAPTGSLASIQNPDAPLASFAPDRRGDYIFELVVSDFGLNSVPATATLSVQNRDPVAVLDGPVQLTPGEVGIFTATGSTDPDNDALSFSFAVTSSPAGSTFTLNDLGNGDASFEADLSGDYTIEVTVSDGLASAQASFVAIIQPQNAAPVLGNINALYTVELGLELALDLTAFDADGDPLAFFASPLPLANGISVDATSGEVRFRPEAGQVGSYSFTVGVSDGVLTDAAVLNIDVVPGTASDTSVFGQVVDGADFAGGTVTPLANIPVRLRDAALMTFTDASGSFNFGSLTAGRDKVIVEPSAAGGPGGYIGTTREITITASQNRDLSPEFQLTPINDGCVDVVAGVETVLAGATSGVTVRIAADTILDPTGAPYTGQVCLGQLPQLSSLPSLPSGTRACNAYGIDAPGAVFSTGVTVSAPNNDLLPDGTRLRLMRQTALSQRFLSEDAFVDVGGSTVSAASAQLAPGTLFTFIPQAPASRAGANQPTGYKMLTVFEGDLNEVYTLPGYRSFNEMQEVGLSYHSQSADPTILVAGDVTIVQDASLPVAMSTTLNIGGLSVADTNEWTPRTAIDGSSPALVGEAVTLSQAMPLDASGLPSGRYGYDFRAEARYACSTVASSHSAELLVQNEANSPYGKGWSIDGLQKLAVAPDGKVAIIDDDGVVTFDPKPTVTDFTNAPLVFPVDGTGNARVTDVDNDGNLDIVFVERGSGRIGTIRNFGGGDLRIDGYVNVVSGQSIPATGDYFPNLLAVEVGDLSTDGVDDVAFAAQGGNTNSDRSVGFAETTASGALTLAQKLTISPTRPTDLSVNDMDGDGLDDLVYVYPSGLGGFFRLEASIIYGGGPFTPRRVIEPFPYDNPPFMSASPAQVITADIDNDGDNDIAIRTNEGVSFMFNFGDFHARFGFSYALARLGTDWANEPNGRVGEFFKLIDANGDGLLDVVFAADSQLEVFLNTSGRNFTPGVVLPFPPGAAARSPVSVLDANGDGNQDLLITSSLAGVNQVNVYFGNGDGTFQPFEQGFLNYPVDFSELADINGDGSLDLISVDRFNLRVHFSDPSASGEFVAANGEFSELTRLPDGSYQRRYKDGMVVEFDANGLQTATIDPQGNRVDYAYGPSGQLSSMTDQVGGVTNFAYDTNGLLASITYPDGRTTLFTYDSQTNLTGITEPTGSTVGFAFDQNGRLISTTNQNGNTTAYTYDAAGNMSGASLPDGSSISNQVASSLGLVDGLGGPASQPFAYVPPGDRVTTITDRKGQITEVEVNSFGSVIRVTDPLGRTTLTDRNDQNLVVRVERPSDAIAGGTRIDTIDYDTRANVTRFAEAVGTPEERATVYEYELIYNKVTKMTDPDGFDMLYEYDAFGEVTKITDGELGERLFSYTPEGQLLSRTDENGNQTTFAYDTNLNLGQITYADASVTAMTYDASGNATTIAEAQGTPIERQIQRTYDNLNRVLTVEVTGANGAQIDGLTTYTYEPNGNLSTVTDETNLVTTMGYDALERLTSVDDPAEGLIRRTYNAAGEVTQHINGDGETHDYVYDEVSRLTQTTDPEGFVKSFAYDVRDNIATVTDGRSGLTQFGYDPLDRMTTRTNPINQTMTRAYDGRDNLAMLTREDGAIETATYDGLSRRTQVVTPDNTLTYDYDARSNLTEAADNDSRVTFTYDTRNRLATTTTDGTVGPQPQVTLSYTYDELDRRTSMSDSLGGTTSYVWDAEDRLTDLTAPWGTVYTFGYDGEGRRTSLSSTSGRNSTYGYTNGLLSALSHIQSGVALTDLSYTYGVDGQLTGIVDNLDPSKSKAISYDQLNRLVQVAEGIPASQGGVPIPVEDYAYDEEGNRTASHLSALHVSNPHNQLTEDDRYTYAYDLKGNRTTRTEKATGAVETYTYDSQNRLVEYASPTVTASYAYDALDRRVAKVVGGSTEAFVYDPWNQYSNIANDVVLDFADGALTRRILHGVTVDEPLAFERYAGSTAAGSGAAHEILSDRLGSVIEVVDATTNNLASSADFDSFGQRTTSGTEERYGFTGREHDPESGLIYFRARHYDPRLGRFVQRDPVGFAAGDMNLYIYVWNDPFNWVDPSGLSALPAPLPDGPANDNRAPRRGGGTSSGEYLTLVGETSTARTTSAAVGGSALALARKVALLIAILPVLAGDTPNDGGPDESPESENTPDPGPETAEDGDCDPSDPACDPRPEDCFGEPGYDLRVSEGDQRLGGSLRNLPLSNIGANEAYRLLQFFEVSVAAREAERREYRSRGQDVDKGHKDRLKKERDIRDRLREKSKGNNC